MTTRDNAPKPPDWQPEPRCCPFADCKGYRRLSIEPERMSIVRGV